MDAEYLSRPHADNYTQFPRLPLLGKPPAVPSDLQKAVDAALDVQLPSVQSVFSPEQLGYFLHREGYQRNESGVWSSRVWSIEGKGEYHCFEEGDRIEGNPRQVDTPPFQIVKTHSAADRYGFRYQIDGAA